MKMKNLIAGPLTAACIAAAIAGMPTQVSAKNIQFGFSPESGVDDVDSLLVKGWKGHTVLVQEMKDQRKKGPDQGSGDVLGSCMKRHGGQYVTSEHTALFCGRSIMFIMHKNGIRLAAQAPSVIVEPCLKYLNIREDNSYQGNAVVGFTVYNAAGEKIWEKDVVDSGGYWGKTFSEETFLGTLRKTLINVTISFLQDGELNGAIANLPRPPDSQHCREIGSPRDLGIRGTYRPAPVGPSIAAGILLASAAVLCVAARTSNDPMAEVLLFASGGTAGVIGLTIGTISIVKWGLWIGWENQKTVMGGRPCPGAHCAVAIDFKGAGSR